MDDDATRVARALVEMQHADEEDALVEDLARARFVLLGEGTHGTREFYTERARLTRRLIVEHGFDGVVLEADLSDTWRVHRFVAGTGEDAEELAALGDYQRFPRWMWRNEAWRPFVRWMARHARASGSAPEVWGLDVYGVHRTAEMAALLASRRDPSLGHRLRALYAGLGPASELAPRSVHAARAAEEALRSLVTHPGRAGEPGEAFAAELAARGVVGAVRWGRALSDPRASAWNVRDGHMADVLDRVAARPRPHGRLSRWVVWAHNSHVGDARPSELGRAGECSLGELVRSRHGEDAVRLVGFWTWSGSVTAARAWGEDPQRMHLRPAAPDTWEALCHRMGTPCFRLDSRDLTGLSERPERAVGVVYAPARERASHLFASHAPLRYDHVLYYDVTRALAPLDPWGAVATEDLPETWPFAL
ncbi:MAG: hypothetical protein RLZZ299_570 [Pseudomonadota bacterium]|jgi:erythromycin esterase-like protein